MSAAPSPQLWPRGDQKPGCPHGHGLMGSEAPAAFEGSDAVTRLVGRQAHSRLEKDRNSPCALPSVTVGTGKTLLLVTAEGRRMALRGLNPPCTQQPQARGWAGGGWPRDVPSLSSALLCSLTLSRTAGSVYFWSLRLWRCLFCDESLGFPLPFCKSGIFEKERELADKSCVPRGSQAAGAVPLECGFRSHILKITAGRAPETTLLVFADAETESPSRPLLSPGKQNLWCPRLSCVPVRDSGLRCQLPRSWRFLEMGRGGPFLKTTTEEFRLRV